jgi:hypothetical protein
MTKDQKDLPGMENRSIQELDQKCKEYDKVKKKRMDLTRREVELQSDMLGLLKKHKIKNYDYEDIHAEIVIEKEKVRVKIAKTEDEEAEAV